MFHSSILLAVAPLDMTGLALAWTTDFNIAGSSRIASEASMIGKTLDCAAEPTKSGLRPPNADASNRTVISRYEIRVRGYRSTVSC